MGPTLDVNHELFTEIPSPTGISLRLQQVRVINAIEKRVSGWFWPNRNLNLFVDFSMSIFCITR